MIKFKITYHFSNSTKIVENMEAESFDAVEELVMARIKEGVFKAEKDKSNGKARTLTFTSQIVSVDIQDPNSMIYATNQ